jgi:hypothetical protein
MIISGKLSYFFLYYCNNKKGDIFVNLNFEQIFRKLNLTEKESQGYGLDIKPLKR